MTSFCGLDVGISTTDAVGSWAPGAAVSLSTESPVESATAAVERLLASGPPAGEDVIAATGVGSHRLPARLCGLRLERIPEIEAIGRGGIARSGRSEALVVSFGTGIAMVSVRGGEMRHVVPGTGVGGGCLRGLARALLGTDDLETIAALASRGDRRALDMTIGEVAGGPLGALPEDGTAANFAKFAPETPREDVAAALVNLIAETALWTTLLGLQASGHGMALLTGKLLLVEPFRRRVDEIAERLGGILTVAPDFAVATALGALWSLRSGEARA